MQLKLHVIQASACSVIKLVLLPRLNVPEGHLERTIMRKMTVLTK